MLTAKRTYCAEPKEDSIHIKAPAFIQYEKPSEDFNDLVTGWGEEPLTDKIVVEKFKKDYIEKTRMVLRAYGNMLPFSFPHLIFYEFFDHMFKSFDLTFDEEHIINTEKIGSFSCLDLKEQMNEAFKDEFFAENYQKLMGGGENPIVTVMKYTLCDDASYVYTYNLER